MHDGTHSEVEQLGWGVCTPHGQSQSWPHQETLQKMGGMSPPTGDPKDDHLLCYSGACAFPFLQRVRTFQVTSRRRPNSWTPTIMPTIVAVVLGPGTHSKEETCPKVSTHSHGPVATVLCLLLQRVPLRGSPSTTRPWADARNKARPMAPDDS